jgi:hypothetical protein
MKKRMLITALIFVALMGAATGCEPSMEKDARELAALQIQKNDKIRSLLACNDSIGKMNLLEDIMTMEIRFDFHFKSCQKKYNAPAEWAAFEKAFSNHLNKDEMRH